MFRGRWKRVKIAVAVTILALVGLGAAFQLVSPLLPHRKPEPTLLEFVELLSDPEKGLPLFASADPDERESGMVSISMARLHHESQWSRFLDIYAATEPTDRERRVFCNSVVRYADDVGRVALASWLESHATLGGPDPALTPLSAPDMAPLRRVYEMTLLEPPRPSATSPGPTVQDALARARELRAEAERIKAALHTAAPAK